jgi:hypothetical protein
MGIDIGYTESSLRNCKYASCRPYRRKVVGVYSEPPESGVDSLLPYRRIDQLVNMPLLKMEEPEIYRDIMKDQPPFAAKATWYWNESSFKDYYRDKGKAARIEQYIENKPTSYVSLDKVPKESALQLMGKVGEDNWYSAWWQNSYERQQKICKPCPIRPLDETNCYIRFSNYPGMNGFRQGFALTTLYANTIDEKRMRDAWFSFPYVDRTKGELPKDKIGQLMEICEGTPVNKGGEGVFNHVVDMLESLKPNDMVCDAGKIENTDLPFIDKFISKYIYREKPYSVDETRSLLPYVETLQEVADWAIWDANNKDIRTGIIGFKDRISSLTNALKIADKYQLEVHMSY